MGRRLESTPRSRVRQTIRRLWLTSRERAKKLKLAGYTCERCGAKQSVAKGKEQKIEVHHRDGVTNWEAVIDMIFAELLVEPEKLECLCPDCHKEIHDNSKK